MSENYRVYDRYECNPLDPADKPILVARCSTLAGTREAAREYDESCDGECSLDCYQRAGDSPNSWKRIQGWKY